MSALRSFYAYYYKHQFITSNPTLLVDMPKLHDKTIVRLDVDESAALLDYIEHCGDHLTGQKKFTGKRPNSVIWLSLRFCSEPESAYLNV